MKRHEAVLAAAVGLILITASLTWKFGAWGLLGCGIGILAAVFFVDVKEGDDNG